MRRVLIIKTGATFPLLVKRHGDFEDWITASLGIDPVRISVVEPSVEASLPDPRQLSGVVVTGSHAMVTDQEDWSEHTAVWLSRIVTAGIPLLGICYGHQLLAHAMGGQVGSNPTGSEFGTVDIRLSAYAENDRLFSGFPSTLKVHACHTQSVIKLPPDATLLASNDRDPHHAFSIGDAAWGVQFHPEFDADIMTFYLNECGDMLSAEGFDLQGMINTVEQTPYGKDLLRRFGKIATEADQYND